MSDREIERRLFLPVRWKLNEMMKAAKRHG
jgi:hypothetical protein